ncbi:N-alpha-acetyltransferase 10, NatA catalytic subunit [Pisolithus croceorrhizus]|nr:N-alpha-acetyltransferase 10, NatA catalytic subunit [Pisolithus croceorrhizus]
MLNIRPANPKDIINIQRCNQLCLPENYLAHYWVLCLVSSPHASFLAEDASGRVVGYVLASVEPIDDDHSHLLVGHINSLAVIRPYRRLGIAKRLMDISKESMTSVHHIQYIQLNVRVSNRAALALYRDVLGYTIHCVEHKYYADGENAFSMRLWVHGDPSTAHTGQERQTVLRALCQYASHKGQLLLACVRRSRSPQR